MPTKQETFDMIVTHLRQQGYAAKDQHNHCAYRGKNGSKCAAGCLIEDDEYHISYEGPLSIEDELTKVGSLIASKGHDIDLVTDLQRIHDYRDVDVWEVEFKVLAQKYCLIYTQP
jgi:hypothetical protein